MSPPSPGALPAFPHRFRLRRGGILNVWQYDQQVFEFGDGRLLLRGKNGAGKTRALEVLLPFLLDADVRALDTTGAQRTSFRWLMLDGAPDSNRLGYVWLELARVDEEGAEHVRTLGAAIKASRATGEAKPTYFITTKRVAEDLSLLAGRQLLPVEALRAAVGERNCFTSPGEYRRRVMRELFGLADERRYRNVLHLLHRLRRPTIGDRIEAGELTAVLSEALPPLDEDVVDSVARNLDELEGIRRELARLEATASAVGEFVAGYRGYVHGQLRGRVGAVREELQAWVSARRGEREAHRGWQGQLDQVERASDQLASLQSQRQAADDTLQALRDSAAYQSVMELRERRRTVQQAQKAAEAAADTVTVSRQAETDAAERAQTTAEQRVADLADVRRRHGELVAAAADVGVDEAHLGSPAVASLTTLGGGSAIMHDLQGVPHETTRPAARVLDVPTTAAAQERVEATLRDAIPVVGARRRTVAELRAKAEDAEGLAAKARRAEEQTADIEARQQRARSELDAAEQAVATASSRYAHAVLDWLSGPVLAEVGADTSPVRALVADALLSSEAAPSDAALSMDIAERVAATTESLLAAPRQHAEQSLLAAEMKLEQARKDLHDLRDKRRRIEEANEDPPARPAWSVAERHPGAGAPFYLLVDFAPHLDAEQRVGLEAALEASGVLAGWVSSDGALLDPATRDLVIAPTAPFAGPTLADLLVPAPSATGNVGAAAVRRLLTCIAATPDSQAASVATTAGLWRLGVTRGAHVKDRAEYIGAATRAATRARRLAELAEQIHDTELRARELNEGAGRLRQRRDDLATMARTVPRDSELQQAWTALRIKQKDERRLDRELSEAQAALRTAQAEAASTRQALLAAAAAANLQPDRDAILAVEYAARRLQDDLARLADHVQGILGLLPSHLGEQEQLKTATARRARAEEAFDGARSGWASQAAQLAALEATVGTDEQALLARERDAEAALREAVEALPLAERALRRTMAGAVGAYKDWLQAQHEREDTYRAAAEAAERLRLALRLPGVLLATSLEDIRPIERLREVELPPPGAQVPTAPVGADVAADLEDAAMSRAPLAPSRERPALGDLHGTVDALARQLAPAGRDMSAAAILNRYEDLRTSLAGGYDASVDEIDGIKVFELHDDSGRQPVAAVAARLREAATRSRETLTRREQEVFERHLLGELGDNLAKQLHGARSFERQMNRLLDSVRSSLGLGVRLEWRLRPDADADVRRAVELIPTPGELRARPERLALREALQRRIDAARQADPSAGYATHLGVALDYRAWHSFTVKVIDAARPGSERILGPRIGLSEGEKRVVSYPAAVRRRGRPLQCSGRAMATHAATHLAGRRLRQGRRANPWTPAQAPGRPGPGLHHHQRAHVGNLPYRPQAQHLRMPPRTERRGVATVHFDWDGRHKRLVSV
jgi:uncharacterized protein (TIGR02680 family)